MSELPHNILIENMYIEIDMLDNHFGLLGKNNIFEETALTRDTGNGLIFMTGGFTISLIWSKKCSFSYLILIVQTTSNVALARVHGSSVVLSGVTV